MTRRSMVMAGAVALVVLAVVIRLQVSVPSDAAAVPVARAVLAGPTGAPPLSPVPPPFGAVAGQACLPRIAKDGGWLDLCWEGYYYARQSDGTKDYYLLRLYGSHQGWRWMSIRSQVVGVTLNAFDVWPNGTYAGECGQEPVSLIVPMGNVTADDLCGRTNAHLDATTWSDALEWTCEGCLVADGSAGGVSMYEIVSVPAGTVPSWDLFASGGS